MPVAHPSSTERKSRDCRQDGQARKRLAVLMEEAPYQPLRRVETEYYEGVAILRGVVPTYYLKQIAQTVVAGVPGVEKVVNHIAVAKGGGGPDNSRHVETKGITDARGNIPELDY